MVYQTKSSTTRESLYRTGRRLLGASLAALLLFSASCSGDNDIPPIQYTCETSTEASPAPGDGTVCGAGDPNLEGMEPQWPTDICATLTASRHATDMSPPSEDNQDTVAIQAALTSCAGRTVKLVATDTNNAFIASHLQLDGVTLWVDKGVTLYASRNPDLYQKTGSCGVLGVNDSGACTDFITMDGTNPGVIGDGVIDGQGGEPLVGRDYSWWQLSYALRETDGSIGNPTLINTASSSPIKDANGKVVPTTGVVLYHITLHNGPKFHVKLTSTIPVGATCDRRGQGFTVWGVTVLTPSKWTNSQGLVLTPSFARNTDGIDPGTTSIATCGLMACNTISTGDDHIALKGGHWVSDVTIAHNHFGTGHGMSIGSETYGAYTDAAMVSHYGVENVDIYDLTIDADSRAVGDDAQAADFNGIRVKSDESRGGSVKNITYRDVCMRDMTNAILVSTAYNPLFAGTANYPNFGALSFQNIHHVSCLGLREPVMTLNGFNTVLPAGPISLDNVFVDNVGPQSVSGQFSNIVLGPGEVNFGGSLISLSQHPLPTGGGQGLAVTDNRDPTQAGTPKHCVFPKLPAPQPPPGWTW
jgi:polygalacturonase